MTTNVQPVETEISIPLLRGYLTRRDTKGTHGWNKMWYQNSFENPLIIEVFSDEKSTKVVETIDFTKVSELKMVRTREEDSSKKKYGFQFKYGKHTQKLLSDGEEEGEYWREGFTLLHKIATGGPIRPRAQKVSKDMTNELGLFPGESFGTTLIDYHCTDRGVLSFKKGVVVIILGEMKNGWLPVEFERKRGWVPGEFVKPMEK